MQIYVNMMYANNMKTIKKNVVCSETSTYCHMPNRDVLAHERLERSEVLHPGFPEDSFASSVAVPPAVVLGLHFEDCGESPPAVVLREESRAKGDALARVGVDKVCPFDNIDGEPGNIDACKGETAGI